jgi:hypothetical protein
VDALVVALSGTVGNPDPLEQPNTRAANPRRKIMPIFLCIASNITRTPFTQNLSIDYHKLQEITTFYTKKDKFFSQRFIWEVFWV